MTRLTSEERRRIFFLKEEAAQRIVAPPLVSMAAITPGGERCRWLRHIPNAVFGSVLVTAGLLLYIFVEFHLPVSLTDAFLPRVEVHRAPHREN